MVRIPAMHRAKALGPLAFLLTSSFLLAAPAPIQLQVTVLGSPDDVRAAPIREAVAYWNEHLASSGVRLQLGPVRFLDTPIPDSVLREIVDGRWGARYRERIEGVPGDVVIALSGTDLISTAFDWRPGRKGFVVLRRGDTVPLSLPNVARNAVAHELGHVLGLSHDGDWSSLMCGRPARCRPEMFASDTPHFFPLTPAAERALRDLP